MSAVTEYLSRKGIPFDVLRHADVQTAVGEALSLGIPAELVAKTIVLDVGRSHVLAVVPASRRLDARLLRDALRRRDIHLATEDELQRDFPQFELGSIPPLGSLLSAPILIDPEVVRHDIVVFASGTHEESVRVRARDLLQLEHAVVTPIARSWRNDPSHRERVS